MVRSGFDVWKISAWLGSGTFLGGCRNPNRGVESLALMPTRAVINNSNAHGLMRSPDGLALPEDLARFPLNTSRTVI
jgi:hypothetical protein